MLSLQKCTTSFLRHAEAKKVERTISVCIRYNNMNSAYVQKVIELFQDCMGHQIYRSFTEVGH